MIEQGFRTAEGIYKTVYELIGQGFETPEGTFKISFPCTRLVVNCF